MTWKDDFYEAARKMLAEVHGIDAVTVTDVYDNSYSCENSLGYSDIVYECGIDYRIADGKPGNLIYNGTFSDLIGALTEDVQR